ncbi:MAG: hypothetical protein J6T38_01765 [Bacteroidaceae bacterium]|nr:hypothetical protein [Bacteroidaceae bacterium]
MKKIQVLLVCLLATVAMQAQTSAKAQTRVAEVRKLYAEAKERMTYNDQDDYPAKSNMEITYNYMAPGAGPIKHYIKYYICSEDTDEGEILGFKTYFVSDSYNSGARKIYEEYLLDEKTGTLLFAYAYEENGDNSKNEGRYYYYKDGTLAHKDVKVNTEWGAFFNEKYVKAKAANLRKTLELVMNN